MSEIVFVAQFQILTTVLRANEKFAVTKEPAESRREFAVTEFSDDAQFMARHTTVVQHHTYIVGVG